jgi:hypothetical protein
MFAFLRAIIFFSSGHGCSCFKTLYFLNRLPVQVSTNTGTEFRKSKFHFAVASNTYWRTSHEWNFELIRISVKKLK